MIFLHINSKTNNAALFNQYVEQGKHIFILFYMEGCGPCNATRPEWKKISTVLKKDIMDNENVLVVDIDKNLLSKVKNLGSEPKGFPTIRFITNNGKTTEDFEDCKLSEEYKNRTIDSFVTWIKFKLNKKETHIQSHKTHKNYKKVKQTGGKWSRKYKNSINCKRPKGFSQKQYCKYSRKKR